MAASHPRKKQRGRDMRKWNPGWLTHMIKFHGRPLSIIVFTVRPFPRLDLDCQKKVVVKNYIVCEVVLSA